MDSAKLGPTTTSPRAHSPTLQAYNPPGDAHFYYIIIEYVERLTTRLNILETELKYAWRALDLLSQEYVKMWQRLEKVEHLLAEQQVVIRQLLEFYINSQDVNWTQQSSVGELDAIAKRLDSSMGLEETSVLREKLAQEELARLHGITPDTATATAVVSEIHVRNLDTLEEEVTIPDEAFYRSLNNAYREDLICGETSRPTSQLGMIWEEAEDEDNGKKEEKEDTEKETKKDEDEGEVFSAADYKSYRGNTPCVSEQDLAELSRLSSIDQVALEKLHELDRLSTKLQDSQNLLELQSRLMDSPKYTETKVESIDEQLRKIYAETDVDSWTFSKSPGSGRSISRVSTDSGLATDGDFTTRSISPRLTTTSVAYTPPRLGYTSAVLEKSPEAVKLPIDVGNFAKGYAENKELTDLMAESMSADKTVRTRQDGYFGLNLEFQERTPPSPSPSSPPPPAPETSESFLMPEQNAKSPRVSPKHKSAIVAKSDSGLSSMSGWSNIDKSPSSPKAKVVEKTEEPVTQEPLYDTPEGDFANMKSPAKEFSSTQKNQPVQYDSVIYSVAGSKQQAITSVYTSGSGYVKPYYSEYYQDLDAKSSEGYKAYRTMFPTGNITDALSYYPTSANLPRTEESSWLNSMEEQIPHDSTSSSIRSLTSDGSYSQSYDRRYPSYQNYFQRLTTTESAQLADGYQRQWQREHQYIQEETGREEFYDASSVIVSQSGYISIATNLKEEENVKMKKIRRGSSLKNAMSSMSSWLPDLHLKRHRSQSLPGGVRREDLDVQGQKGADARGRGLRKKKKHTLVSTVSGILQKAKRRSQSQSLSDPEQSETEWSSGRQSGLSEDEESITDEEFPKDEPQEQEESTGLFQTVGDIKRTGSSDEAPNEKAPKLPPVTLIGSSMEFAVSRALGKYRQRQSSSVSDEVNDEEKKEEIVAQESFEAPEIVTEKEIEKPKLPELVASVEESSPRASRFPRHQQSLEIPWTREDEDNKSTHSYRSTSRVSSRRQSTEDSIDSEDEWYCYELRKLEELERQQEEETFEPDESIKQKMSVVLKELKLKARKPEEEPVEEILDKYRDEKPIPKRKSESIEAVFARVTDYHTWATEEEAKKEKILEEASSGETSGPDSPGQSMDEEEEEPKDLEEQSRRSSSGSTLRQGEKILQGSDSLSREGSVSVPPSEVSVSIPGAWDSESTVLEGFERDGAGSAETATTATLSLPKIKIDSSSCGSSDATLKEGQVSPGPPGSKWKLLKALKERKAEEKLKEVEEAKDAITQGPTAVSIMIK